MAKKSGLANIPEDKRAPAFGKETSKETKNVEAAEPGASDVHTDRPVKAVSIGPKKIAKMVAKGKVPEGHYGFTEYDQDARDAMVKTKHAMKGGRFPIKTEKDVDNALDDYNRIGQPANVLAHIKRNAAKVSPEALAKAENWGKDDAKAAAEDTRIVERPAADLQAQAEDEEADTNEDPSSVDANPDDPGIPDDDQDLDDQPQGRQPKDQMKAAKKDTGANNTSVENAEKDPSGSQDADPSEDEVDDDADAMTEPDAATQALMPAQDDDKPTFDSKAAYMARLHQHLKESVSPEEYAAAQAKARGHAGGSAPRKKVAHELGPVGAVKEHLGDLRDPEGVRLFIEFKAAGEEGGNPPEWVPFLPKPGVYKHSEYGTVAITRQRLEKFVEQFNDGVYQTQVPLDLEHETKLSGAAAWVKELRMCGDGHVEAKVEWTERGAKAYSEGRFRYISPEWYDDWDDPISGKRYSDVVIGGALTVRPFFKEKVLPALVASETGLRVIDKGLDVELRLKKAKEPKETRVSKEVTGAELPKAQTVDAARFAELETKNRQYKERIKELEGESKHMTERIQKLEKTNRITRFTERAEKWFGDKDEHVQMLETLSVAFGEGENTPFETYCKQHDAAAEKVRASGMFTERGSSRSSGKPSGSVVEEVEKRVSQKMTEKPDLSKADAMHQVFAEDEALLTKYRRETYVRTPEADE